MLITPSIKIHRKSDPFKYESSSRAGFIGANDENSRATEYVTKCRPFAGAAKTGRVLVEEKQKCTMRDGPVNILGMERLIPTALLLSLFFSIAEHMAANASLGTTLLFWRKSFLSRPIVNEIFFLKENVYRS